MGDLHLDQVEMFSFAPRLDCAIVALPQSTLRISSSILTNVGFAVSNSTLTIDSSSFSSPQRALSTPTLIAATASSARVYNSSFTNIRFGALVFELTNASITNTSFSAIATVAVLFNGADSSARTPIVIQSCTFNDIGRVALMTTNALAIVNNSTFNRCGIQ
jgi:hypothetical protein